MEIQNLGLSYNLARQSEKQMVVTFIYLDYKKLWCICLSLEMEYKFIWCHCMQNWESCSWVYFLLYI